MRMNTTISVSVILPLYAIFLLSVEIRGGHDKTRQDIHSVIVTTYVPSSTEPTRYTSDVFARDTANDAERSRIVVGRARYTS